MIHNGYNRRLERWIISHQTGRRNLTKSQLVKAYASVEEQLKREAKEKEQERKTTYQKSEKSSMPTMSTAKEVAKLAGVSHDTIHQVEVRTGELLKQKKLSVPKSFSILRRIIYIPETDANEKIPTKITVYPDTVYRFSLRKLDS